MIGNLIANARFERVLRLLDQERQLILSGPLARLAGLVERREAALAALLENRADLPEAFLAAVQARAERNGRLLAASLEGLRAAQAQLVELATAKRNLGTYTAAGLRVEVQSAPASRDLRA